MQISRCVLLCTLALIFLAAPLVSSGQSPLQFIPITPCRIVDTRGSGTPIQGGTFQTFAIQGSQGSCKSIPGSPAAYSLNVTVVPHGALGYLTVWPAGQQQPVVSTLNSLDGRTKANAAIIPAGSGGAVSVYASNTTDLVLDLNGYFVPATGSSFAFYPLPPCRVLDSRGGHFLVGQQTYSYPVTGLCNVPSTAMGYALNFTVVPRGPLGYLTAWPAGQSQPNASILNAPTGTITANAATIQAGTDMSGNNIEVFASNDTDLVIDVDGYFAPANSTPGGLSLFTLPPCRLIDTRPNGQFNGTLSVNADVGSCGLPNTAQAVVVNATVVPPAPLGYLTTWANGQQQPTASTLNALDGQVTSNMAFVPTSNGYINAFASNPTQLVVDLFNYFAIPSGLNGNYTFNIEGYNMSNSGVPYPCSGGGQVLVAGSFMADGSGHVPSGVFDLNCSGGTPLKAVPFTGTYSIQPNGLGTVTITLSLPKSPHLDLSIAISSTGNGRLIFNSESNSYLPNAWGAGAINVQNPADLQQFPVGNFASGFSGVDPTLNRYAGAGAYQIDQSQKVNSTDAFVIDNGTEKPLLVNGSLTSAPDPTTGRGGASLILNGALTHWIYYVTSANQLTFLSSDPITSPTNLVLQTMLLQSTSAFDATYLKGTSVIRTSGLAQSSKKKQGPQGGGSTDVVLGLFTGDGVSGYSVSLDENDGGTLAQQQTSQGTYSVASDGLVTLNGNPLPLFYLVDKNEAFELGSVLGSVAGQDNSVASGFLAPQSGGPFSNGSAIGIYWGGNSMPVTMDVTDSIVTMFADGNSNLNGTNVTSGSGGVVPSSFSGTYSVDSTGRMTLNESGKLAAIVYVISPTRVAVLPAGAADTDPSVSVYGSTN